MSIPARVHILMAREAPVGLVLRRGPSKQVCTLRWDRRGDTFEIGQWLKGRIYEDSSDISPDGRYWIYKALNGKWWSGIGQWVAVARVPFLKALAFYPHDCGGEFTSDRTYWICQNEARPAARDTDEIKRDVEFTPFQGLLRGWDGRGRRLVRDGWLHLHGMKLRCGWVQRYEKMHQRGWTLRKIERVEFGRRRPGQGLFCEEHELVFPRGNVLPCPDWEWADLDGQRVVWVSRGKLFAAEVGSAALVGERELYDFNPLEFEEIVAPY